MILRDIEESNNVSIGEVAVVISYEVLGRLIGDLTFLTFNILYNEIIIYSDAVLS